jgi:hypothetical protein
MLAYAGPETILPLSSALAVVTGAVVAFWPRVVKVVRALISRAIGLFRQKAPPELPGTSPESARVRGEAPVSQE